MWCTWSLPSSFWNFVFPLQVAYCRPLSVSISLGGPNSPVASRYVSTTFSLVWLRYTPSAVMYRA